jgi:hypothetical protein
MHYHRIALLSILASCVDAQVSPCIICQISVTAPQTKAKIRSHVLEVYPAELIEAAMLVRRDRRRWYELDRVHCCYAEPVNPCNVCLNGDTDANDEF